VSKWDEREHPKQSNKWIPNIRGTKETVTTDEEECRPVRLFSPDPTAKSRIVVDPEGLGALRALEGPVALVTVVGRARSGKSLTANAVVGVKPSSGFAIGHSVQPVTIGAYLWPRPLEGKSTGDGTSVVLVDTEGLGIGPASYDQAILLVATAASSVVVYHVSEMLCFADVVRLYGMACLVDDYASRGAVTPTETGLVELPSVAWTVQRFEFDATEWERLNGGDSEKRDLAIVMSGWMNERDNPDDVQSIARFNYTVRLVKRAFKSHSAYLAPPASVNPLQLDTIPYSSLSPGYRKSMERLREDLSNAKPTKTVAGRPRTGRDIAELVEALVEAANDDVDVLGDRVVDAIMDGRAKTLARDLATFVDGMTFPADDSDVAKAVSGKARELARSLDSGAVGEVGSGPAGDHARATLFAAATREEYRARTINAEASERTCSSAHEESERYFLDAIAQTESRGALRVPQFVAIANAAVRKYESLAVGPSKEKWSTTLEVTIGRRRAVVEASEIPRTRTAWLVAACVLVVTCHVAAVHISSVKNPVARLVCGLLFLTEMGGICIAALVVATVFSTPPVTFERFLELIKCFGEELSIATSSKEAMYEAVQSPLGLSVCTGTLSITLAFFLWIWCVVR